MLLATWTSFCECVLTEGEFVSCSCIYIFFSKTLLQGICCTSFFPPFTSDTRLKRKKKGYIRSFGTYCTFTAEMVSLVDWVGLNYTGQYKASKKCWISILRDWGPNLIHRASPDQEVSIKLHAQCFCHRRQLYFLRKSKCSPLPWALCLCSKTKWPVGKMERGPTFPFLL